MIYYWLLARQKERDKKIYWKFSYTILLTWRCTIRVSHSNYIITYSTLSCCNLTLITFEMLFSLSIFRHRAHNHSSRYLRRLDTDRVSDWLWCKHASCEQSVKQSTRTICYIYAVLQDKAHKAGWKLIFKFWIANETLRRTFNMMRCKIQIF